MLKFLFFFCCLSWACWGQGTKVSDLSKAVRPYAGSGVIWYDLRYHRDSCLLCFRSVDSAWQVKAGVQLKDLRGRALGGKWHKVLNLEPRRTNCWTLGAVASLRFQLELKLDFGENRILSDVLFGEFQEFNSQTLLIFDQRGDLLLGNVLTFGESYRWQTGFAGGGNGVYVLSKAEGGLASALPPYELRPLGLSGVDWRVWGRGLLSEVCSDLGLGTYRLSLDSLGERAWVFHVLEADFPKQPKLIDLLGPLEYLCSAREFEGLRGGGRAGLDSFWLGRYGSGDLALSQFKRYYRRVRAANLWFTADKLGWQTDRGLIFILMGEPSRVHRHERGEHWVYLPRVGVNGRSVEWFFRRRGQAYDLVRDGIYAQIWQGVLGRWGGN